MFAGRAMTWRRRARTIDAHKEKGQPLARLPLRNCCRPKAKRSLTVAAPIRAATVRERLPSLEHEAQGDLRTAGIGAVGEGLAGVAVADVRHAVGGNRLEDAARAYAVGGRLDERIVNRVEGVEGFKREVALHAFAERNGARKAGIHVVNLVDVDVADRQEGHTVPAARPIERAVGQRDAREDTVSRSACGIHGRARGVRAGHGGDAGKFPAVHEVLGERRSARGEGRSPEPVQREAVPLITVVMPESSQPFTKYLANAEVLVV